MSFVNVCSIMGAISELHCIDLRISNLYRQKFSMMRLTGNFGRMQCKMARLKPGEMTKFQLYNFSGNTPKESTTIFTNPPNIQAYDQNRVLANLITDDIDAPDAIVPVRNYQGEYVPPGGVATDPESGAALEPGEIYLTKEDAEGMYKEYLAEIDARETEIDMEIEQLKAKRTALVAIKEEAQKYVKEGIQGAFRNNYMG